jgi:hypothetical protein
MSSSLETSKKISNLNPGIVNCDTSADDADDQGSDSDFAPGGRRASTHDSSVNKPWIHLLSPELLRTILDHLDADLDKFVNLEHRAYLSQESFKAPGRPQPNQAQDIANFRLTCKEFSELGAMHQFSRVTTRFSQKGFERLENIASQPHLAKNVRKFSYMVPFFYEEGMAVFCILFKSRR